MRSLCQAELGLLALAGDGDAAILPLDPATIHDADAGRVHAPDLRPLEEGPAVSVGSWELGARSWGFAFDSRLARTAV